MVICMYSKMLFANPESKIPMDVKKIHFQTAEQRSPMKWNSILMLRNRLIMTGIIHIQSPSKIISTALV